MMTNGKSTPHVLILAGGDGTRLRSVTRVLAGDDRPKQFCALVGREPLLVETARRAAAVAHADQTLLILTRPHEEYYRELLSDVDPASLVVQPENRGTAAAVLYGLLRIAARTPDAPVVILPSDHWVSDDAAFMRYAQDAIDVVEEHPNAVVLLGIEPSRPEPEYGWIEPADPVLGRWRGLHRVSRFVEKPSAELAVRLQLAGSLWNTSVVVGQVEALLFLFATARPDLVDGFLGVWASLGTASERAAVERLYASLPTTDFSRDILAKRPENLAVLPVASVSWEDLGRPGRILEARRRLRSLAARLA
ncbi:MAG TPA: sugar phosphate nucleotidyltransferase [Thermoanaerobaculia bacterium]